MRNTKTLNLSRNIVAFQVFGRCFSFFTFHRFSLVTQQNICCGLKQVVAQSSAMVNFEQQSLALLLVFHQTLNLSRNKFVVMPPS